MGDEAEQLAAVLRHTFDPDATRRTEAEKFLSKAAPQPGFLVAVLRVVASDAFETPVRLAAAVQLKNYVRLNWTRTEKEMEGQHATSASRYFGSARIMVLRAEDKDTVRSNLVEALARSQQPALRKTLAECIKKTASEDFPERWPNLIDDALKLIVTQDPSNMHAGLLVLDKVFGNLTYAKEERRKVLDEAAATALPLVHQLLRALLDQNVNELYAAELMKMCGKVFFKAFQHGMPPLLADEATARSWAELFVRVVRKPLPDEFARLTQDTYRDCLWWKAKRRAAEVLSRLLSRYGFLSYAVPADRPLVPHVVRPGGIASEMLLPTAMWVLQSRFVSGQFWPNRVVSLMLIIVEDSVELSVLFKQLKPDMEGLIRDVLFRMMRWGENELESWQHDPMQLANDLFCCEFRFNESSRGMTTAGDAACTVEALGRMRKRYALPIIMQVAGNAATAFAEKPDDLDLALNKAAALRTFECIAHVLKRDSSFNVADLVGKYILPDLSSRFPFVRFSACEALVKFIGTKWDNPEQETAVAQAMIRLVGDSDLLVRVAAGKHLTALLRNGTPAMLSCVTSVIPDLTRQLLRLTSELSLDDLFTTLQALIANFPSQVVPMGAELCHSISDTFLRLVSEEHSEDDELAAGVAATTCIESLSTLLSAFALDKNNEGEQDGLGRKVMASITPRVIKLIDLILASLGVLEVHGDRAPGPVDAMARASAHALMGGAVPEMHLDMLDFLDSALHLVHLITYNSKAVPPTMWLYVPIFARILEEHDSAVTLQVYSILETMVHYDPEGFLRPGVEGINNVVIVLGLVTKSTKFAVQLAVEDRDDEDEEDEDDEEDDFAHMAMNEDSGKEAANGAFILCTALQACPGKLDDYVKPIVDLMLEASAAPIEEPWVVVNFLNCVQSAVYYNPSLGLRAIGADNLDFFISQSLQYLESNVVIAEKMIAMLAFVKILAIAPADLPPVVNERRESLVEAVAVLAKGLDKLRTALAEAKAKAKAEAASSGQADKVKTDLSKPEEEETMYESFRNGVTDTHEDLDTRDDAARDASLENMTEEERMAFMTREHLDEFGFDDEDDEDDDGDDATSPVDDVDEYRFFFQTMQQAAPAAREELERILQKANPEVASIIRKMIEVGQQRG